jgi:hypothetical protein
MRLRSNSGFLVLTQYSYSSYLALGGKSAGAIWLAADVLSESELELLRANGTDATVFNYTIDPQDYETISCALETIKEHHPNQCVWVEN